MSIIEQADEIVGITERVGMLKSLPETVGMLRRGAYIEWIATQDESICIDELIKRGSRNFRVGMMPLDKIAEAIVAIHAATQPKGDGLPEGLTANAYSNSAWRDGLITEKTLGAFVRTDDLQQSYKVAQYLNRCLSNPVRRLLAEFDITDERPNDRGVFALGRLNGEAVMSSAPHYARFPLAVDEVICWIVPKAVKP